MTNLHKALLRVRVYQLTELAMDMSQAQGEASPCDTSLAELYAKIVRLRKELRKADAKPFVLIPSSIYEVFADDDVAALF